MHRALTCVDILDEVFIWFDIANFFGAFNCVDDDRICTLARSARVCKAFFQPAIRVLWRRLEYVTVIFHTLPSFVKVHEDKPRTYGGLPRPEYRLPRDVPSAEWDRLSIYAVYVETLHASQEPSVRTEEMTQDSWRSLKELCHDKPIFPNLRDLFWLIDDDGPESIIPFLSPTIKWLSLFCSTPPWDFTPDRAREWQKHIRVVIGEISARVPLLRELSVSTCRPMPPSFATTPLSDANFIELRVLGLYSAEPLRPSDLAAVSRIASLESLELSVVDCKVHDPTDHLLPVCFNNLRRLRLDRQSAVDGVFDLFTAPSLQRLDVHDFRINNTSDLRRMCAAWARSFPALQELICMLDEHDTTGWEPSSISSLVAPFCGLRGLSTLCVWLNSLQVTVDDHDLSTFAEAWPSLKTLIVQGNSETVPDDFIAGLPGLIALAKQCPHLQDLRLSGVRVRSEDVAQLPRDSPVLRFRYLWRDYSSLP
ncbi:hypothetical protein GY45DRAFT_1332712 [Cubamyces sp. BRFM 1775]|nr:hypothetical protein GY45DRAFT_1332712 [Cubamyces sp. BRFM 1775]